MVVSMDDFKKEQKRRDRDERKQKFIRRFNSAVEWIEKHQDIVIPVVTVGVPLTYKGIRMAARSYSNHCEMVKRDRQIWDPSSGSWLHLKHKMTAKEVTQYTDMLSSGMKRAEALRSMNLIK